LDLPIARGKSVGPANPIGLSHSVFLLQEHLRPRIKVKPRILLKAVKMISDRPHECVGLLKDLFATQLEVCRHIWADILYEKTNGHCTCYAEQQEWKDFAHDQRVRRRVG
jgi:hypothetical protein